MRRGSGQQGGVFFYLLIILGLIGTLVYAVSRMGPSQSGALDAPQARDQASRLIAQAALLSGALEQMVTNGADRNTLAADLSTITGGNDWDTPPHLHKIYHPYGGGVTYTGQTGTGSALSDTANMADNFQIRVGSVVAGVGATDTSPPSDILFTARVSSLAACRLINNMLRGTALTADPPTVTDDASAFDNLFTSTDGTTDATLEDTTPTCAACVGVPASCVRNAGGTLFGYYQVLMPG